MVDWIKCIPFVGTGISAVETVQAVFEGNGQKALWKLGETAVGGAMDALTIVSVGTSTIATTSAKAAGKIAVTAAAKNVVGATFVRAVGTTATGNQAKNCYATISSGSGGGDDDQSWKKQKRSHELELDDEDSPITKVTTDNLGRVNKLSAGIRKGHLRPAGSRKGAGYSEDVKKHVATLGKKAGDQVGHIIGWALGGPCNYIYNYFPQHPKSNRLFYHELEKKIQKFLRKHPNGVVYIRVDFYYNGSSRRPCGMDFYLSYWLDEDNLDHIDDFHWYNDDRNVLSKPEYRKTTDWWLHFKNTYKNPRK